MIKFTSIDVHPPLYYLVLKGWTGIFGISDLAFRSFSVICALLGLGVLYLLIKKLFNTKIALFATMVTAISPLTIRYAQETRMYSLASLFLLMSTYLLVIQLERKRSQRTTVVWAGYAVFMALALYTHYFTGFMILVHLIYVFLYDTKPTKASLVKRPLARVKQLDKNWIFSLVGTFVLFLPWLPTLIKQFTTVNNGFWIPDASLRSIGILLSKLFIFRGLGQFSAPNLILITVVTLLLIWVTYSAYKELDRLAKANLTLLLSGLLIPAMLLYVISHLPSVTSLFYQRYFSLFSPFFYGGVGVSLAVFMSKSRRRLRKIIVAFIVASLCIGTLNVLFHKDVDRDDIDLNQTVQTINKEYEPGDAVIASQFSQWFIADHYNRTGTNTLYLKEGVYYGSLEPIFSRPWLIVGDLKELNYHPRVWLIRPYNQQSLVIPSDWKLEQQITGIHSFIELYKTSKTD